MIYVHHITQSTQLSTLSRGLHLREIPTWHFFANSKSAIQNPNGFVWAKRKKEKKKKNEATTPLDGRGSVWDTIVITCVFFFELIKHMLISRNNSTILEYSWSKSKSKWF